MATATPFNFDERVERRGTDSGKWGKVDPDVLPMWTADMDFRTAPAIIQALHERVEHGVFGYGYSSWTHQPTELIATLQAHYANRYNVELAPEDLLFVPGVVAALYGMAKLSEPNTHILIQTPNYWPIFSAAEAAPREIASAPLVVSRTGDTIRYEVDFDAFEAAITPQTHLFLFSNPHNPVGRAYERWELERMAEICLRHDLIICSDEIHCELVLGDNQHIPMMSLSPEVADRCVTLVAATKAFNLAGFKLGIAISQNHELLANLEAHFTNLGLGSTPIMGYVAALAAFRDSLPWLDALRQYLTANRDYAVEFVQQNLPGVVSTCPEATYLLLMDCTNAGLEGDPCGCFLDKARVALSGGFGTQGPGFDKLARLNFGCPQSQLAEVLERMQRALV